MTCIITIPVYKSQMNQFEEKSFRQCCKVLGTHPICIVTYEELDLTIFYNIALEYDVTLQRENYNRDYFVSVKAYNSLMLSRNYYHRFDEYDYMLIYQLDAYVFRDELEYWCNKGYDYIGAPWFEDYGCHEDGKKLWAVGNGGFSLRRLEWFNKFLNSKRLFGWKELVAKYYDGTVKSFLVCVTHWLGYWQSCYRFLSEFGDNEDKVFAILAQQTRLKPQVPPVDIAMKFAFEQSPSWLYSMNKELPFGCHAWGKYEYESFWKNHISE